jgi:hypothetical protein
MRRTGIPTVMPAVSWSCVLRGEPRAGQGMRQALRSGAGVPSGPTGTTGKSASRHAAQPPTSARALCHPARLSSRTTRVLVSSFLQAQ